MSRLSAILRQRLSGERGATLVLIAMTITVVLGAGALAVDLSAMERRGQTLQNVADAASLAAVRTWSETGDKLLAQESARNIIVANGEADDSIEFLVEFPEADEVAVTIVDPEPDILLASAIGPLGEVARTASAQHRHCEACYTTVETVPPFTAIRIAGSGDGLRPIPVGDRLYAINHHEDTIGCANRTTESICWPRQELFPYDGDVETSFTSFEHEHGGRIAYVGSDNHGRWRATSQSNVIVTCWDTSTDEACRKSVKLDGQVQAMVAGIEERFWVFTQKDKVFCFFIADLSTCPGYTGGRTMATTEDNRPMRLDALRRSDILVHEHRIYLAAYEGGFHSLTCWDTQSHERCAGFGQRQLPGGDVRYGRLFVHYSTVGEANAICGLGTTVTCFDLADGDSTPHGAAMHTFASDRAIGHTAVAEYHEPTNRMFMASGWPHSNTYCWDFETVSSCGARYDLTPLGRAVTYAYYSEGDCMIGFGDKSIFFTFSPETLEACESGGVRDTISLCGCGLDSVWPTVWAVNLDGVDEFRIRLFDEADNLLYPIDGSEWVDLADGRELDLETELAHLDPGLTNLAVQIDVVPTPGSDPWSGEAVPSLLGAPNSGRPHLVE